MVQTLTVDTESPDPEVLEEAFRVILAGGILIYPTDTLYALGGMALDPRVSSRVRKAKGRSPGKPLSVIASDLDQAKSLCAMWPTEAARLSEAFWPGPLTLVLPASSQVPSLLSEGSVAIRIPALPLARELCRFGPLISTSANRAGEPPPMTCAQATAALGAAAELALDGGEGKGKPSTLVDLQGEKPRELRPGAVSWEDVSRVLEGARS